MLSRQKKYFQYLNAKIKLNSVDPKISESEFDIYYPHQYDPYQSKPVKKHLYKKHELLDLFLN